MIATEPPALGHTAAECRAPGPSDISPLTGPGPGPRRPRAAAAALR